MRSSTPKVLHELCGLPMVHWPIRAARAAGAARVIVVTSPGGELDAHLPEGVELAVQPVANGTGGAVAAAAALLGPEETVVVINGDAALITTGPLTALVAAHAAAGAGATVATIHAPDPSGYGRVIRDEHGAVLRIVETRSPGDATEAELAVDEINVGIYAFQGAALHAALPRLRTQNAQGELYLTDVLALVERAAAVDLQDPGLLVGVNDRAELARANETLQRRILDDHMRAGVSVVNPASTVVDAAVVIGQDTVLDAGVVLRGATTIGAGCHVGPQVTLTDCTLGDHVTVRHACGVEATAHDHVSVGPFAYLRPGTVLRERAKAGTFVEIKNSDIGPGAKVPHLSYIGDADVGEGTNLGAATITANYDGRTKHRTTIGRDVRSGVDVSFVAPVTVGDRAVTAAGSVITQDVPAGALGIARARQRNLEDYAPRQDADAQDGSGA
ncbi:MAG: bifunctional N-acetylglucosamine-phosphate uridyltransferase/glucosamine-phosphate [Solirubrobacterales bacterium]|nr:bifunctional N-acetylglucosamine-phosphate uridyltransferase/glucosamine-phosphate [Solirubrobacterales bacterium]